MSPLNYDVAEEGFPREEAPKKTVRSDQFLTVQQSELLKILGNNADKALLHFVRDNNVAGVRLALMVGADPSVRDEDLRPVLFDAFDRKSGIEQEIGLEIAALLLQAGADINDRDPTGFTVLHEAASHSKMAAVDFILDHNADVNARAEDGMPPLFLASITQLDNSEIIKKLVARGADLYATNYKGDMALHFAAQYRTCHFHNFKTLVDLGFDVQKTNYRGQTPLHHLMYEYSEDKIQRIEVLLNSITDDQARTEYPELRDLYDNFAYLSSGPSAVIPRNFDELEEWVSFKKVMRPESPEAVEARWKAQDSGELLVDKEKARYHREFLMDRTRRRKERAKRAKPDINESLEIPVYVLEAGIEYQTDALAVPPRRAMRITPQGLRRGADIRKEIRTAGYAAYQAQKAAAHASTAEVSSASIEPRVAPEKHQANLQDNVRRKLSVEEQTAVDQRLLKAICYTKLGNADEAFDQVKQAIADGADVNAHVFATENLNAESMLQVASRYSTGEIVTLLLENKADAEATTPEGYTALFLAAKERNMGALKALLAHNPKLIRAQNQFGETVIHKASHHHDDLVLEFLLVAAEKADVGEKIRTIDLPSKNGERALHLAAHYSPSKTETLLRHGAKTELRNRYDQTPLASILVDGGLAGGYIWPQTAPVLLKYGADKNVSIKGVPLLHALAQKVAPDDRSEHSDFAKLKLLFRYGADPDVKDKDGLTADQISKTEAVKELFADVREKPAQQWNEASEQTLDAASTAKRSVRRREKPSAVEDQSTQPPSTYYQKPLQIMVCGPKAHAPAEEAKRWKAQYTEKFAEYPHVNFVFPSRDEDDVYLINNSDLVVFDYLGAESVSVPDSMLYGAAAVSNDAHRNIPKIILREQGNPHKHAMYEGGAQFDLTDRDEALEVLRAFTLNNRAWIETELKRAEATQSDLLDIFKKAASIFARVPAEDQNASLEPLQIMLCGPLTGRPLDEVLEWQAKYLSAFADDANVSIVSALRGKLGYLLQNEKRQEALKDRYTEVLSTPKAITARDFFDVVHSGVVVFHFLGAENISEMTSAEFGVAKARARAENKMIIVVRDKDNVHNDKLFDGVINVATDEEAIDVIKACRTQKHAVAPASRNVAGWAPKALARA